MSIGERIKNLRKQYGLNQTEMGKMFNLNYGAISAIESGRSNPSIEMVEKLSKLFNVSTDYIIKGTETEQTLSESEQEIIEALRKDEVMSNAMIEFAKLKKKVISYARSYRKTHAAAA
jgi:transcriptional regulator with XRE-family HTH domain